MRRDVFQAISDPVRREIIDLLSEEPQTVNTVAERFDISRPAISKHLRILHECGIVDYEQRGRERYCYVRPKTLVPAFLWLDQYRGLWEEKLDAFETYLSELKAKRKTS